ncbi:MAG: hypothetical protein AB7F59_09845 [Bdellovibrionales bacterium]
MKFSYFFALLVMCPQICFGAISMCGSSLKPQSPEVVVRYTKPGDDYRYRYKVTFENSQKFTTIPGVKAPQQIKILNKIQEAVDNFVTGELLRVSLHINTSYYTHLSFTIKSWKVVTLKEKRYIDLVVTADPFHFREHGGLSHRVSGELKLRIDTEGRRISYL